jgi:hypothetical protein
LPPSSTITATAICGLSTGAKAVYQACGAVFLESVPCSAVPVFDAIWTSGRLPPPLVKPSEATIMSLRIAAFDDESAAVPVSSVGL